MRIAILGNSGSGKSTLASWLAERSGAQVLDLDTVAWVPGGSPVPRASHEAEADVVQFCEQPTWIVEGCYADLVQCSLSFNPHLLFLNPGVDQCIANCIARPWEPHKYASREEQDSRLAMLLEWVHAYYSRTGSMSYETHRSCFAKYQGQKTELLRQPTLDELSLILDAQRGDPDQ